MENVTEQIRSRRPNVLLVEDNELNQTIMLDMLEELGCQVDAVPNAQQALERLSTSYDQFNVIFMDISLPDLDGVTATKIIRAQEQKESRLSPIPIVAITGHMLETEKEKCLNAGMNEFTIKPVDNEEVQNILYRVIFPHNVAHAN